MFSRSSGLVVEGLNWNIASGSTADRVRGDAGRGGRPRRPPARRPLAVLAIAGLLAGWTLGYAGLYYVVGLRAHSPHRPGAPVPAHLVAVDRLCARRAAARLGPRRLQSLPRGKTTPRGGVELALDRPWLRPCRFVGRLGVAGVCWLDRLALPPPGRPILRSPQGSRRYGHAFAHSSVDHLAAAPLFLHFLVGQLV